MLFLHFLEQNRHIAFEIGSVVRDFGVRDSFINDQQLSDSKPCPHYKYHSVNT